MVSIEIGLSTLVVFVSASIALIVASGPDSLYVLMQSISGGQWTGLSSAFGTSTGILVHTSAAVLGLSAILRTSAFAYTVVKYAGALYLLYFGIQTIRHKEEFELRTDETDTDTGGSYRRGVMINSLNPKVAIFFLAFLPQFVTPGPSAWLDMLLLGVLYATLTLLYLGTLALMSSRVKTVLTTHPRVTDVIRWAAGSVIVGFGIELAISDRTPN
jgi:threonine/homoserine/homoserine lactone efflux protein